MQPPSSGFASIARAFRSRNYAIYVAGNSVSLIGTWMHRLANGWLAWELTHSTTWLGLIAFADLFPMVLVTPIAGTLVDRLDRRNVTMLSQALMLIQAVILAVLVATGGINIWLLLALTLFLGAVAALNQPARLSLIPALVDRADVNAAVRVNSIIFNLARFVGPLIAGVLISVAGIASAFALNAASTAVFLVALWRIRLPPQPLREAAATGLFGQLADGLRYTFSHPELARVLTLLAAASIFGRSLVELMPGFAGAVFGGGPQALSAMTAAIGVGAVAGGLTVGGDETSLMRILVSGTFALAGSTVLVALMPEFWMVLGALALFGAALARTGIASQTLIQLQVDEAWRGRVLSIYGVLFRGAPAVGALAIGAASEFCGLRISVFVAGAALFLFCLWAWIDRRHRGSE